MCFVADETDVGGILVETVNQELSCQVCPDKNGYLVEAESFVLQGSDLLGHVEDGVLQIGVFIFLLVEFCSDVAFLVVFLCYLFYVGIDVLQFDVCIRLDVVEQFGSRGKEVVVEVDDDLMAAIVGVQWFWMNMEALQFFFFFYVVQYLPVAATPSVDAL